MRVMVLVKADERSESGAMPETGELEAMGAFNDELIKAGVLLIADGLLASSHGKRVRFDDSGTTVLDGPFAETKELVAGFWLWQVDSLEEAAEWLKRAPFRNTEVEIRRVAEMADFGDAATPDVREHEARQRDEIESRQQ